MMISFERARVLILYSLARTHGKDNAGVFLETMDLDKNGKVDFNEFVESFRLVHTAARAPSGAMP